MKLGHDARKYIVQQIENSLSLQGGNFTGRDGELHNWFIEHLEGVAPLILLPSLTDKALLRLRFTEGYNPIEIGKMFGVHKSTIYKWCDQVIDKAIDIMPEEMAMAILEVRIKQRARAIVEEPEREEEAHSIVALDIKLGRTSCWLIRGCTVCGGSMYLDLMGSRSPIEWCCLNGHRIRYRGEV